MKQFSCLDIKMKEQSVENLMRFVAKRSSPNFASNVKQIEVNQLALFSLKSSENPCFFDDFKRNRIASIRLILEVKFVDDP